jgi:hypothetical protein
MKKEETGKKAHINTRKRICKFNVNISIFSNLIEEFPVRHWDKVRKQRQRTLGGDGEENSCVGDKEWYLTDPYILCSDFGTEIVPETKKSCRLAFKSRTFSERFCQIGIIDMPFGTVTNDHHCI